MFAGTVAQRQFALPSSSKSEAASVSGRCRMLAQLGHAAAVVSCPLLGAKQTSVETTARFRIYAKLRHKNIGEYIAEYFRI
jgi:hypothetical protein